MQDKKINKIIDLLKPNMEQHNLSTANLDLDKSLLEQGVIDSISFLEFIVELESVFDIEIDFSELDPNEFTSIKSLVKLIGNENRE
jgi:acyl carrier protein